MAIAGGSRPSNSLPRPIRLAFKVTDGDDIHGSRPKRILRDFPQVRQLIGRNPWTAIIAAAISSGQLGLAWWLSDRPWWQMLLAAILIGAFASHALFVVIHEATHRLIFRRLWANRAAGIFANLAQVIPSAQTFERYHLLHHAYMGEVDVDVDLPSRWEVRLFNGSAVGRAAWMFLMPVILMLRPVNPRVKAQMDGWIAGNIAAVLAF